MAALVTDKLATSIEIAITFEGRSLVLALTEPGSIMVASLRDPLGDLMGHEYEIRRALDRLFSGF